MKYLLLLLFSAEAIFASGCPFGDLAGRGLLSPEQADNFYAARAGGEAAVEAHMRAKKSAEFAAQAEVYKRQTSSGQLSLGGGLLNGTLQPFTGILSKLQVPIPQAFGLKKIPGDDPLHQFQYAKSTDVRGPCPALNTLANHGYVSRTGITTFAEAANACQIAFGIAYDNCVGVAALALISGGDLPSGTFSIGGADARVPNTLGPSLGASRHGFFQTDSSVTRQDTYFGNAADFQLDRFNRLTDITKKYQNQFNIAAFAEERVLIYNEAKKNNPEFNAGVHWLAVSLIERVFVTRGFANGTNLDVTDYNSVSSFYLNEKFPENWYRRPRPYSFVDLGPDMSTLIASSPELTLPGQNQGFNNFVPFGLDISNVSPNMAICFFAATVLDSTPGFLAPGLVANYKVLEAFWNGAVKPFFAPYNCNIDDYATPAPSAGDEDAPGESTSRGVLVNGTYQASPSK